MFGRTRGAILALLYGRADQTFYTRQIAREVAASVGAVQRELKNLTKVGLVIRTALGQPGLLSGKSGCSNILRDALPGKQNGRYVSGMLAVWPCTRYPPKLPRGVCVRIVARQAETAQSDIDLMVVGKASIDDVISQLCQRREEHWKTNKPDRIFSFRIQGRKLQTGIIS